MRMVLLTLFIFSTQLMAYETIVESNVVHYNGETITLTGHVAVENTMGRVIADSAILKKDPEHLTKIDFPWIELKKHVQLNLSKGGTLNCESLFFDYTTLSAHIEGNPQIIYRDVLGEVYADRARIDYQEKDHSLEVTKVILYDNVRLLNRGSIEKPASQYALADIVYYFPPDQVVIMEGVHNQVLFFDKERNIQLIASNVRAERDPITKKESVQGLGEVRFVFGPEELDKIKTRFQFK